MNIMDAIESRNVDEIKKELSKLDISDFEDNKDESLALCRALECNVEIVRILLESGKIFIGDDDINEIIRMYNSTLGDNMDTEMNCYYQPDNTIEERIEILEYLYNNDNFIGCIKFAMKNKELVLLDTSYYPILKKIHKKSCISKLAS